MASEWRPQEPAELVGYVVDTNGWDWAHPENWTVVKRPDGGTLTAAEINTIRLNHTPDPIRQTNEQAHLARVLGRIPGMTDTEYAVLQEVFGIPDTPPLITPPEDAADIGDKDVDSILDKLLATVPTATAKEIAALKARLGARS